MSMNVITVSGRISRIGDLKIEKKIGENGAYEKKTLYFDIAVEENYSLPETDKNGYPVIPSCYFLCKATGKCAETLNKYSKDDTGKLMSRTINIVGRLNSYMTTDIVKFEETKRVFIKDKNLTLSIPIKEEKEINKKVYHIIVNEFQFMDPRPSKIKEVQVENITNEDPGYDIMIETVEEPKNNLEAITIPASIETNNTSISVTPTIPEGFEGNEFSERPF